MILSLSLITLTSLVMTMFITSSPLSLGLWIMLISMLIAIFMSMLMSSWLSMLIFLIYIGGLLVMFIYFSALIPNQIIPISSMLFVLFLNMLLLTPIFYIINMKMLTKFNLLLMSSITNPYLLISLPTLICIVLILFFALVSVVKITFKSNTPLRPFNYV